MSNSPLPPVAQLPPPPKDFVKEATCLQSFIEAKCKEGGSCNTGDVAKAVAFAGALLDENFAKRQQTPSQFAWYNGTSHDKRQKSFIQHWLAQMCHRCKIKSLSNLDVDDLPEDVSKALRRRWPSSFEFAHDPLLLLRVPSELSNSISCAHLHSQKNNLADGIARALHQVVTQSIQRCIHPDCSLPTTRDSHESRRGEFNQGLREILKRRVQSEAESLSEMGLEQAEKRLIATVTALKLADISGVPPQGVPEEPDVDLDEFLSNLVSELSCTALPNTLRAARMDAPIRRTVQTLLRRCKEEIQSCSGTISGKDTLEGDLSATEQTVTETLKNDVLATLETLIAGGTSAEPAPSEETRSLVDRHLRESGAEQRRGKEDAGGTRALSAGTMSKEAYLLNAPQRMWRGVLSEFHMPEGRTRTLLSEAAISVSQTFLPSDAELHEHLDLKGDTPSPSPSSNQYIVGTVSSVRDPRKVMNVTPLELTITPCKPRTRKEGGQRQGGEEEEEQKEEKEKYRGMPASRQENTHIFARRVSDDATFAKGRVGAFMQVTNPTSKGRRATASENQRGKEQRIKMQTLSHSIGKSKLAPTTGKRTRKGNTVSYEERGGEREREEKMPKDELETALFALFSRQYAWTIKALMAETRQPAQHLKEVLHTIAEQGRAGSKWTLKPHLSFPS